MVFVGHIGGKASQRVFNRGVLALGGRDEHISQALHTGSARGGDFVHHRVEHRGVLGGKLCQAVGNDGGRRAVTGIVCGLGSSRQGGQNKRYSQRKQ